MRISDRYRRAVVGLGSAALAATLGLSVHFVAGDPIGLSSGELAGGDGLATPIAARALGGITLWGGATTGSQLTLPEEPSSAVLAERERRSTSEGNRPRYRPDDDASSASETRPARPRDDGTEAESDEASAAEHGDAADDVVPPAQALPAASEGDVTSWGSSVSEPDPSPDPETPRASSGGEVDDDGPEVEPPEGESDHDSEPEEHDSGSSAEPEEVER